MGSPCAVKFPRAASVKDIRTGAIAVEKWQLLREKLLNHFPEPQRLFSPAGFCIHVCNEKHEPEILSTFTWK